MTSGDQLALNACAVGVGGFWAAGLKELEAVGMVVASDKVELLSRRYCSDSCSSPLALVYKLVIGSLQLRD